MGGLLDGKDGVGQVTGINATPAACHHGATAPHGDGLLEDLGIALGAERHGPKADINRRVARGEEGLELGGGLPVGLVTQRPVACDDGALGPVAGAGGDVLRIGIKGRQGLAVGAGEHAAHQARVQAHEFAAQFVTRQVPIGLLDSAGRIRQLVQHRAQVTADIIHADRELAGRVQRLQRGHDAGNLESLGDINAETGVHVDNDGIRALAHVPAIAGGGVDNLLPLAQQCGAVNQHGLVHGILEARVLQEGLDRGAQRVKLDAVAFYPALEFFGCAQNCVIAVLLEGYRQGEVRLDVALRADRNQGNALQVSNLILHRHGAETASSDHLQYPEEDL